ncbi:hypothetical protein ACUVF5_004861, partial [Escherichia coli]
QALKSNAAYLSAQQSFFSECEEIQNFYSVMIQASSGMPVVFVRNSYRSKGGDNGQRWRQGAHAG